MKLKTKILNILLKSIMKRWFKFILIIVNIGLSLILFYNNLFIFDDVIQQEQILFKSPDSNWVNLLSGQDLKNTESNSLNLVFYAKFKEPIRKSSLRLFHQNQINLLEEIEFWGGSKAVTAKQFLCKPAIHFLPTTLDFTLKYRTLNGIVHRYRNKINLIFSENFTDFAARSRDNLFWTYGKGINKTPDQKLLCEPRTLEKTKLVFVKNYNDNADVSFHFSFLSSTPNLEISFSERISFLIGDANDNEIKFKAGKQNTKIWSISRLKPNNPYYVKIKRRNLHFLFQLKNLITQDTIKVINYTFDESGHKSKETYPLIAFWVYSNQLRNRHVSVRTLIDNIKIFFPKP